MARSEPEVLRDEIPWFADLHRGTGAAAGLDRALRRVLQDATADIAEERGRLERRRRLDREAAERDRLAEQERRQREEALRLQEQARRDRAARRRPRDRRIVGVTIGLCGSVVVPWLIGLFLIRGVYSTESPGLLGLTADDVARLRLQRLGDYFLGDWLGGCAVLLVIAALCLLPGSWSHRGGVVGWGLLFAVLAVCISPPAAAWAARTGRDTDLAAQRTAYPFSSRFFTCGGAQTEVTEHGSPGLLQFWTARRAGTDGGCNRVEVYRGWSEVTSFDLPKDAEVDADAAEDALVVWGGDAPRTAGAVAVTTDGFLTGTTAADPSTWWRVKLRSADGVELLAGRRTVLVYTDGGDRPAGELRRGSDGRRVRTLCGATGGFGNPYFDGHVLRFSCSDGERSLPWSKL